MLIRRISPFWADVKRILAVSATLLTCFLSLIAVIIAGKMLGFSPAQFKDPDAVFNPSTVLAVLAFLLAPVAVVALVQKIGHRQSFFALGFGHAFSGPFAGGAFLGAITKAMALLVAIIVSGQASISWGIPAGAGWSFIPFFGWYLITLFLNSLNEELAYRSYPIQQLPRIRGLPAGTVIIGTAAIFAGGHFLLESPDLLRFLYRFAFGVAAALLFLPERNIWTIIGFHTGWNFVALSCTDGSDWRLGKILTVVDLKPGSEALANVVFLLLLSLGLYLRQRSRVPSESPLT